VNWRAAAERLAGSHFLRFAIVGAGGFIVDVSILSLLHFGLGLDRYSARAISILTAMTFTWWGNRNLTFRAHAATERGHMLREWLRFALANSIGNLSNYATYSAIVTFAPAPLNNPLVATLFGTAVGLVFNFTLSKRFVFRVK
jgi:putative flippase GtrA